MVGWKLEVFKMGMYMTFPVAMFYIFNQPQYFEEYVTKTKRELYPPDRLLHHEELQKAIREMRGRQETQMLNTLDEIDKKKSMEKY